MAPKGIRFCIALVNLVFVGAYATAQSKPAEIFGQVRDQDTGEIITQGSVIATDRHLPALQLISTLDTDGKYTMILPYDRSFKVEFLASGYVTRHVLIDLNGIGFPNRQAGFGIEIDARLFKAIEGIDHSIFEEEPTGICLFDKTERTFVWDASYIASTRKLVQGVLDQHRSRMEEGSMDQ